MIFKDRSLPISYIPEPKLGFAYEQSTDHPKDGLTLYGPPSGTPRPNITMGVIGTSRGLGFFKRWAEALRRPVKVPAPTEREKKIRLHLSDFPGLEETFGLRIDPDNFVQYEIKDHQIDRSLAVLNHHESVSKTVDLYMDKVIRHGRNEERSVDVWVFVVREDIFKHCRSQSRRAGMAFVQGEFSKKQSARTDVPLLPGMFDEKVEEVFDDVPDFHRQVKARLLKLGQTSQMVRETTLAPDQFVNRAGYPIRGTQDVASTAWNFATGLYYKTQPEPPWKIADMRPGVCYVGLVFKLIPNHPQNHACCAAQMFLSEGDGVVFRGANGPWMTENKEFHLEGEAATRMIETVLETYKTRFDAYPEELFIHGKTTFSHDEWEAFSAAAPPQTNIVGVRIKSTYGEMKLFREGDYPCIRGTALKLDPQNAYLWTSGYLPRLDTYVGPETPNPLHVTVLRSTGELPDMDDVLRDIMGLTKINYNACNYSDGQPVTIRFAEKVGDVLVMGSAQGAERQPFKFYI